MPYRIIAILILLSTLAVTAQVKSALDKFNKQPHRSLRQTEGTRYTFTDHLFGTNREKDLGEYTGAIMRKGMSVIDSTVFTSSDYDTVKHAGKFVYWQDVDAACGFPNAPFVGDINKNGRAEIYGSVITFNHVSTFETVGPLAYFELHTDGKFGKKFQFPYPRREIFANGIVDLDNDGIDELHVRSTDSLKPPTDTLVQYSLIEKDRFMKQINDTSLAIQPFFKWPKDTTFTNGREKQTWGDFDNDGKKDVVFISDSHRYQMVILEYNQLTKYLDSVYSFEPGTYTQGYSIGDFDSDGKTDIVMGSIGGKVFVVENTGDNTYQNVWTSTVETNNAYLHFWTNDIDGNGKKEFWVGGDGFFSGIGMTRLTCFESNGNNSYVPVARIDFVGIFSFLAGNIFSVDADHDGKEEIGICVDRGFFLMKFIGSIDHHSYKIIYAKTSEYADYPEYPGEILGVGLYDMNNDGKLELLASHELAKPSIGRVYDFVRIYKQALPLSIRQNTKATLPASYELSQNYPNPFNSSTSIKYRLPEQTNVLVKIYSILGKEIKTLINQEQEAGEYRSSWNGTDDFGREVSSGIYLLRFQTNNFTSTIKLVFIK